MPEEIFEKIKNDPIEFDGNTNCDLDEVWDPISK
jgi:hypothetical protein